MRSLRMAMAVQWWKLVAAFAFAFASASACDETPKVAAAPDASEAPPPPPPPREGCAKTGAMAALESDPSCVVHRVPDDAMRTALKNLSMTLTIEPNEVSAGATTLSLITITNTSPRETTIYFEARPRTPGPRTDWSRVVGIPEPKTTTETPRLFFPLATLDSYNHEVDALPTVSGSATLPPPPVTTLAVHLRPGGKLTHNASWWALRIPAPAPIVQDDAGHRYIPKTSALPLMAGEYTVAAELPLYGLSKEERKITTRVRVVRATLPDGGLKKQQPY